MKKLFFLGFAACLMAVSCCKSAEEPAATDRLLGADGKPLGGIEAIVSADTLETGMVLRSVAFVNTGSEPVKVAAMETSRITLGGSEVWSLQPSSTTYRKDCPLCPGLHTYYNGMDREQRTREGKRTP